MDFHNCYIKEFSNEQKNVIKNYQHLSLSVHKENDVIYYIKAHTDGPTVGAFIVDNGKVKIEYFHKLEFLPIITVNVKNGTSVCKKSLKTRFYDNYCHLTNKDFTQAFADIEILLNEYERMIGEYGEENQVNLDLQNFN